MITLREFCEVDEAFIKVYPAITDAILVKYGLKEAVDAIYSVFVESKPKMGCVLLWAIQIQAIQHFQDCSRPYFILTNCYKHALDLMLSL